MTALRNLVLGTLALILVLIGIGVALPDQARIERSVLIQATAAEVFTVLNSFERVEALSPWTALDPKMQFTPEGPSKGLGARLRWFSEHPSVGSGQQEIVESEPDRRLRLRIDYTGFDGDNHSTFTLTPEGEGTQVVWIYETAFKGNLIGRYVGLMLDSRVGAFYEQGLLNLKMLVEGNRREDVAPAP